MLDVNEIIKENKCRLETINAPYNPITGLGSTSIKRKLVIIEGAPLTELYLPTDFAETNFVKSLEQYGYHGFIREFFPDIGPEQAADEIWKEFIKKRIKFDFEYWAFSFIIIKAKGKPVDMRFKLNRAQRHLLKEMEEMRLAGVPIEIILLKARQWGGSTLIQIYMLWIQLVHRTNWNSVICGDIEGQARTVRNMVTKAIKKYPPWLLEESTLKFTPFEGSTKNRVIENTNCVISIGSAQKPDSLRSGDISMAHLTEVGLWKKTEGKEPEDLIQSIVGSIYETDYSLIALESTAKGVGNYFNRTWNDAVQGKNNLHPVFIPWFLIDIYSAPIKDYKKFIESFDEYDYMLWNLGATLEAIAWYKKKSRSISEKWRLNSEFPSTPEEAFQSTGRRRFRIEDVAKLKQTCIDPDFIGDLIGKAETGPDSILNLRFERDTKASKADENKLWVWSMPDDSIRIRDRYIVVVDIGGTSDKADWTDIAVFDRYPMIEGDIPEVVAEWHGHLDHDKVAWKSVQIASIFGNALLVIESNTLETEGTEGDNFEYILDEIADHYPNLYSRTSAEEIKQGKPRKWGFHTNTKTKPMVIDHQVKVIRDDLYIERCEAAVFEHNVFEIKEDGKTMGAVEGMHDDRLITRAIGNYICWTWPRPKIIVPPKSNTSPRIISEASM